MEEKLLNSAMKLPEPKHSFAEVEKTVGTMAGRKAKSGGKLHLAFAAVLAVCLVTTVFALGEGRYGLWSGGRSVSFADVKLLSRKYDYVFPEQLGGIPFGSMDISYGAPQGTNHIQALLKPTYKLYGIAYQTGTESGGQRISVSFGSTESENWKYHFSVAEDGSSNDEGVLPGSQSEIAYEGNVLHRYRTGNGDHIRWEEESRKLVISITVWDDQLDVVEIAKELINLNQRK